MLRTCKEMDMIGEVLYRLKKGSVREALMNKFNAEKIISSLVGEDIEITFALREPMLLGRDGRNHTLSYVAMDSKGQTYVILDEVKGSGSALIAAEKALKELTLRNSFSSKAFTSHCYLLVLSRKFSRSRREISIMYEENDELLTERVPNGFTVFLDIRYGGGGQEESKIYQGGKRRAICLA